MKKLETLGKTTWKKIKIGEVFAFNSCWCIFEKVNNEEARLLASDVECYDRHVGTIYKLGYDCICTPEFFSCDNQTDYINSGYWLGSMLERKKKDTYLQKLPLSVQRLYRED